jgi:high-affinity iron transporter
MMLLLAAAMVSGLILSMIGKGSIRRSLHEGMARHLKTSSFASWGLAIFAFLVVLREGIEIVLFFAGIRMASGGLEWGAALAGAAAASALAWALFRAIVRFDAGHFLRISALLLILLAGGLAGAGVHELQEAHVVPEMLGTAYNINPPAPAGGPYPLLHEKGLAGGALKGVLGVPFSPSWEQLLVQGIYLGGMLMLYGRAIRKAGD